MKYNSLQEEVDENRKLIEKLRMMYKQEKQDKKDLDYEHEVQRQDLLDNVRELEREVGFCHEVFKVMFKENEVLKIRGRATYDDDKDKWVLPPFYLKDKEVNLPKLKNNKQFIAENLDKRDIVFEDSEEGTQNSPQRQP